MFLFNNVDVNNIQDMSGNTHTLYSMKLKGNKDKIKQTSIFICI